MDWITEKVAIGNYLDAQDIPMLKEQGFGAAMSLDGTLSKEQAAEYGLSEIACYRLIDGAGNDPRVFKMAVENLRRLVFLYKPVFVQCHAGRSRSAAIVAGYLMQTLKLGVAEAIEAVAAKREINITPELVDLLYKLEG